MADFKNEWHRNTFEATIQALHKPDYSMLAAIYLLTADERLWAQMRPFVRKSGINFEGHYPKSCYPHSYALFRCAKDLYMDEDSVSVSDLADMQIISQRLFNLICNAMAISRYGLRAIQYSSERKNHE